MSLEDKPRSGWLLPTEDRNLHSELEITPSFSTQEMAAELGTDKLTIH